MQCKETVVGRARQQQRVKQKPVLATRPPPAPEIGTQDRQREKKNISVNSFEVKSSKIPTNLQNRRSNLGRMGVEQKPLYVTQVDKLEAKIQVKIFKL